MKKRDLFKQMLSELIAGEKGANPLDLRAGKEPFTYKDNEIFPIDDLDGAYDYVKDSEDWFVDIYENIWEGKIGHANYTGSALTSSNFNVALKACIKKPMQAYEKFEARIEELGLWDEWCRQGKCGRIATGTTDGIIILCNEGENDNSFTESLFPHMSEMQEHDSFRLNALAEFCDHDDVDFVYRLCLWVARPAQNKCPLFPVDVYFCWENPKVTFFEDDPVEPESIAEYVFTKTTEEYCEHCEKYVELSQELKAQKCPNCGKWIIPCSACPLTECARPCPLERMVEILNK